MAGRPVGYAQLAVALLGLGLSTLFAARFFGWYLANSSRLLSDQGDPMLGELWQAVRWPLLGIAIFLTGWLWALLTSWAIVREARKAPPPL